MPDLYGARAVHEHTSLEKFTKLIYHAVTSNFKPVSGMECYIMKASIFVASESQYGRFQLNQFKVYKIVDNKIRAWYCTTINYLKTEIILQHIAGGSIL